MAESPRSQHLLRVAIVLIILVAVGGMIGSATAALPVGAQPSPGVDAGGVAGPASTAPAQSIQIGQPTDIDGGLNQVAANGSNSTTGRSGNGTASGSGKAIPSSCEEVQNNPQGQGPNYRVVKGSCTIQISDGQILSNVFFQANGQAVNIFARGSGWTVRNIAIVDAEQGDDTVIDLQVNSRSGRGVYHNNYIDGTSANAIFVNRHHTGHISISNSTFLDIGEDALYGSPPGNPGNIKPEGFGGTISVDNSYIKGTGHSNEEGYGFRFGSDGSSISNSVITGADVGVANLFAGGKLPARKSGVTQGVTMQNVDIGKGALPVRLNSHQGGYKAQRTYSAITQVQGVRVEGGSGAVQRNEIQGVGGPIVQGTFQGNPDLRPPAGAPRSAVLAASGIGGGTGSIGGPITGDSGSGGGSGATPLAILASVATVLAVGVLIIGLLVIIPFIVLWKLL